MKNTIREMNKKAKRNRKWRQSFEKRGKTKKTIGNEENHKRNEEKRKKK